jgi:glucokinase
VASDRIVLAIDVGGTKVSLALVTDRGAVIRRVVVPSPREAPADAIAAFAEHVEGWPEAPSIEAVGMALPAIVDGDGRVEWAAPSVAPWRDFPVRAILERVIGIRAVALFDGYAATMGEAVFGAGQGRRSLVALIVGTGFGAGVWVDGRVVRGSIGVAGAVGHIRWPVGGLELSAPVEDLVSGPGILHAARDRAPDLELADPRDVFRAARAGHAEAAAVIAEAAHAAGVVAGAVMNVIAPDVVVWTGGVGSRADFSRLASRTARRCCQPFAAERTILARSRLGAESSLLGAAAAALQPTTGRVTD